MDIGDCRNQIKAAANCRDLFSEHYPNHFRAMGNCACPWHEDREPSLEVTRELAWCHAGCGKKDAIDIVQEATGQSHFEAVKSLCERYGIDPPASRNGNGSSRPRRGKSSSQATPPPQQAPTKTGKPKDFTKAWTRFKANTIPDSAFEWAERERGFSRKVLEQVQGQGLLGFFSKFGEHGAFCIPAWDLKREDLLGIQYLPVGGGPKKFGKQARAKNAFFHLDGGGDHAVVVEGVYDAIAVFAACRAAGVRADVYATFSANTGKQWRKDPKNAGSLSKLSQITATPLCLYFDRDKAGMTATAAALNLLKHGASLVDWSVAPETGKNGKRIKDANDLYLEDPGIIARMVRGARCPEPERIAEVIAELCGESAPTKAVKNRSDSVTDRELVRLEKGRIHDVASQVLDVMRRGGNIYDRGGELIRIKNGVVYPVLKGFLVLHLNSMCRFEKFDKRSNSWIPTDCPEPLAGYLLQMPGLWGLPRLRGIVTAPIISLDGRLLESPGYDEQTGILLDFDPSSWEGIPERPTHGEIAQRLKTLWTAFQEFPFKEPVDRGCFLAALLTSVVRPVLPTAPGFMLDAPSAGSGKTLLARCLAALAGMDPPSVLLVTQDDEEYRKRLFAVARRGAAAILLDNLSGQFRSEAICGYLTSPYLDDRVLGASTMISVPTNNLFLLTGNNVTITGDLNRRVLRSTIDPACEEPWARAFDVDPLEHVRQHRFAIVAAALTILRGYLQSGMERPRDRLASFEEWSDLVRGAVCWIKSIGALDVDDPVQSIRHGFQLDPETEKLQELLNAWVDTFGKTGATVSAAIKIAKADHDSNLWAALDEVAGDRGDINPRRLGRWIEGRQGRVVNGMRFVRGGTSGTRVRWNVQFEQSVQFYSSYTGECQNNTNNRHMTIHIRGGSETAETYQTAHATEPESEWIDEGLDDHGPTTH